VIQRWDRKNFSEPEDAGEPWEGMARSPDGTFVLFDDYKALAVLTAHLRSMDPFIAIPAPQNGPHKLGAARQFMDHTGIQYVMPKIPDAGEVEAFFAEWTKRLKDLNIATRAVAFDERGGAGRLIPHIDALLSMNPPWGKVP
jgi:hypothetical protein